MYIKNIKAVTFKGNKNFNHSFTLRKPALLIGANGSGKTSVIQALRFGLTGMAPLNPIYGTADSALVSIDLEDENGIHPGFTLDRLVKRPNRTSVSIMGKTTTGTSEKAFIAENFGLDTKELKVVTSSEALASMKPGDLGNLFLKHDKRRINLEDVKKIFLSDTSKLRTSLFGMEEKLPSDFESLLCSFLKKEDLSLEDIEALSDKAKGARRENKALYEEYHSRAKDFHMIVKPEYDEETLNRKLNEILAVEKNIEMAKKLLKSYQDSVKAKENQDKQLDSYRISLMSLGKVTPFNKENYLETVKEIKALEKEINTIKGIYVFTKKTISSYENNIKKLEESVCPLSKKILCTTDKSMLINDMNGEIEKAEKEKESLAEIISKKEEKLESLRKEKENQEKNKNKEERKKLIEKAIEEIEGNPIIPPEKPEIPLKSSYSSEKKDIQDALKAIRLYKECEADYKKSLIYKRRMDIANYIYKATDDGGIVKETFIKGSVKMIEEAANMRAGIFNPDMKLTFLVDGGLKVLFNLKGINLPYESLSKGEKITAVLILMDVLNNYLGSTILILDELNDLDEENFERLLNFVLHPAVVGTYTNVVLSCVNHKELVNIAKKYGEQIDIVEMT